MSKYVDRAKELRAITEVHYNCAQSVFLPFAEAAGMNEECARGLASNFGAGMKMASVCGAITGGLMALGLCGVDDEQAIGAYYRRLKERHAGVLDCASLLKINQERGQNRKVHCDAMVFECVALAEELLRERGKLPEAE